MEGATKNGGNGGSTVQTVLNILLVIVCCVIFGLFIHDYIKKNNELAAYKQHEREWMDNLKTRKKKVTKLADIYKTQAIANATDATAQEEDIVNSEERKKIQQEIANHVSENLSPIFLELDKDSNLTNKKLDKITNDLIAMIGKETKKSESIRQEMDKQFKAERAREDNLQKQLAATRAVYTDLYGYACELRQLYVDAHEDDSVLGNIGTAVMAPVKVVQNTLSFNPAFGRDKIRAGKETQKKLDEIKQRYESLTRQARSRGNRASKKSRKKKSKR
jgi:hypothetical protein